MLLALVRSPLLGPGHRAMLLLPLGFARPLDRLVCNLLGGDALCVLIHIDGDGRNRNAFFFFFKMNLSSSEFSVGGASIFFSKTKFY